jgi:hypothetical protein
MMLHDLYNIFKLPPESTANGGAGNFSIAVVLLCITDGLAVYLYPTRKINDQGKRFKQLIRDKMCWGPPNKRWMDKGKAAKLLYLELRNPLVHELGADKVTSARLAGHSEPRIGKWGSIPEESRDIDLIEGMQEWNKDWPILEVKKDEREDYVMFSGAAMYWAVKRMISELVSDGLIIENAVKYLDKKSSSPLVTFFRYFERLFRYP